MKFLKAVRLDVSDEKAYAADGAAQDGEWLACGGFATGVWIAVQRTLNEQGFQEHYKVFERLMIGGHRI